MVIKPYLLLLLLISCSFMNQMSDNRSMIRGEWKGTYDSLAIKLSFQEDKGVISYLPSQKSFSFSYSIQKDTVLKLVRGKITSFHRIKYLDKNKLRLVPYPEGKDLETTDLIDQVEFVR